MLYDKSGKLSKDTLDKNNLIKVISRSSDRYGDKLLDFMNEYKIDGLNQASKSQLEEYIENNKLK